MVSSSTFFGNNLHYILVLKVTSRQQWQCVPARPPECISWFRYCQINMEQSSCCRCLMHAITIKGLRQLCTIGRRTQSSILYWVLDGEVSWLMPENFAFTAIRQGQWKGTFSVTNRCHKAPWDCGAFLSRPLNSWVAILSRIMWWPSLTSLMLWRWGVKPINYTVTQYRWCKEWKCSFFAQ